MSDHERDLDEAAAEEARQHRVRNSLEAAAADIVAKTMSSLLQLRTDNPNDAHAAHGARIAVVDAITSFFFDRPKTAGEKFFDVLAPVAEQILPALTEALGNSAKAAAASNSWIVAAPSGDPPTSGVGGAVNMDAFGHRVGPFSGAGEWAVGAGAYAPSAGSYARRSYETPVQPDLDAAGAESIVQSIAIMYSPHELGLIRDELSKRIARGAAPASDPS